MFPFKGHETYIIFKRTKHFEWRDLASIFISKVVFYLGLGRRFYPSKDYKEMTEKNQENNWYKIQIRTRGLKKFINNKYLLNKMNKRLSEYL